MANSLIPLSLILYPEIEPYLLRHCISARIARIVFYMKSKISSAKRAVWIAFPSSSVPWLCEFWHMASSESQCLTRLINELNKSEQQPLTLTFDLGLLESLFIQVANVSNKHCRKHCIKWFPSMQAEKHWRSCLLMLFTVDLVPYLSYIFVPWQSVKNPVWSGYITFFLYFEWLGYKWPGYKFMFYSLHIQSIHKA